MLCTAIHKGANWQDDGAKKQITYCLEKSIDGADLPAFLLEGNGAYPVY